MSPNSRRGGGTPTSLPRAPLDSPVSSRRQKGGRSPNEKGGPTRRGGRGRRGGADSQKHSSGVPAASPLLEEFRASKSRDWSVIDIKGKSMEAQSILPYLTLVNLRAFTVARASIGHVVEFCQDQNGSRFIQQRLEIGDLKEKQIVVNEVLPEVDQLRNDVFGNYVVQKLFEFGTPEMRADLRDTLRGEMLPLSLQMYG